MTSATHVTHGQTAARLEKLRKLVTALLDGQLTREQIADLLKMGPSGVRGYLHDLAGLVTTAYELGAQVVRLAVPAEKAREYLISLATLQPARPAGRRSDLEIAERQPGRHFHIIPDDEHCPVRVLRKLPAHTELHAAFFGAGPAAMGARA